MKNRTVVIGVGNILLKDEGVGVHVVGELAKMNLPEGVSIHECGTLGLYILNYLDGTDHAIIVDTVKSGKRPGTVSKFLIDQSRLEDPQNIVSMHQIDLIATLSLGREMVRLPSRIVVVGVEPKDISMGLELSDEVKKSIPRAVKKVLEEIRALSI